MLMNVQVFTLYFLYTIIFISCNNDKKETHTKIPEVNNIDPSREKKTDIKSLSSDSIIKILQGQWKETEYPFRHVHFKNSMVKFTEEGLAEESKFQEFQILNQCPFEVNNLKNASPNDIFLVMTEALTCEIVKTSGDSLTLSGFNTNTRSIYNIVYRKVN